MLCVNHVHLFSVSLLVKNEIHLKFIHPKATLFRHIVLITYYSPIMYTVASFLLDILCTLKHSFCWYFMYTGAFFLLDILCTLKHSFCWIFYVHWYHPFCWILNLYLINKHTTWMSRRFKVYLVIISKKGYDAKEHERLSNITFRHILK